VKVVYHPRFEEVYSGDPAARAGRMGSIVHELPAGIDVVAPEPASTADIGLVHSSWHIGDVMRDPQVYEAAMLAAGGALEAARLAMTGEPAFALIRPPGHHASPDHCWGFCFFNNVAISVAKLRQNLAIHTALILDIDLHFGDGTESIFSGVPEVTYFHPEARDRGAFVESIADFLDASTADLIAVSAGFDRHEDDWGSQLATEDYHAIARLVNGFSERACGGRRYAVLEGGYNHAVLGRNVRAFIEGMS
jgi:acetoin utilization deacetylase AcuC-like enzyme